MRPNGLAIISEDCDDRHILMLSYIRYNKFNATQFNAENAALQRGGGLPLIMLQHKWHIVLIENKKLKSSR